MRRPMSVAMLASTVLFSSAVMAQAPMFDMHRLQPLVEGQLAGAGQVNDAGVAIGVAYDSDDVAHAVTWRGGIPTQLPISSAFQSSGASRINNAGDATGTAVFRDTGDTRNVGWKNGSFYDFKDLPFQAVDVTGAGLFVGTYYGDPATGNASRPATSDGKSVTFLDTPDGYAGRADLANEAGWIGGIVFKENDQVEGPNVYGRVWKDGGHIDLMAPEGNFAWVHSVTNSGEVLFSWHDKQLNLHQGIWRDGTTTYLPYPEDASYFMVDELNSAGQMLALRILNDSDEAIYMYGDKGQFWDVEELLLPSHRAAGWRLTTVDGLNEKGWMIGGAVNELTHERASFMLTPVPEPGTVVLALFGLGLVGLTSRSKKKRQH